MKNNASIPYTISLIIGDCLALLAAFAGAFILRVTIDSTPVPFPVPARTYISLFLALVPFWILVFALLSLYRTEIYEKRFREAGRLLIGSFIGMMFAILWEYFSRRTLFPAHSVPVYGLILAFVFLLIFRNLARLIRTQLFGYNHGLTHILIVGNTKMSQELIDWLIDSKHSGYKVVGIVGGKLAQGKHVHLPLYHTMSELLQLPPRKLHQIIQTELYADDKKNQEILNYAQTHHIDYKFVPGNTELFVGNLDVELFRSTIPMIAVHQTALLGWGQFAKRTFDIVVGGLLLLILSPFLLVIALIIKLVSHDTVFFRQTRLTRFNNKFRVFKFRTQYAKYDGTTPEQAFEMMGRPELAAEYRANGDYLPNDPRITPMGRFLRRTSIDELPQLINVVKGDISLVGPRPLIPQELSVYNKRHAILSVKSGLTGLAQVSGRRSISFEERRTLDIYYVQNWTFWLDITILFKTLRSVFSGEGAK